mgnify:CR=1 FL=1
MFEAGGTDILLCLVFLTWERLWPASLHTFRGAGPLSAFGYG